MTALAKNRRVLLGVLTGAALMSAGCVTINIYFPVAAAEKAADRIIDEVWQLKGGVPSSPPSPSSPSSPSSPAPKSDKPAAK